MGGHYPQVGNDEFRGRLELTTVSISIDRARDPGHLLVDSNVTSFDSSLPRFYPQWFEYAGMLPTWDHFKHYQRIAAFVAGNYSTKRVFF